MTEALILLLVKSVLLAAVALSVTGLLRRFAARRVSAAVRHLVCVGGFAALVLLPALSVVLPAWHVASVVAVVPSVAPAVSPPAPNSGGAGGGGGVASLDEMFGSGATPSSTPPELGAGGLTAGATDGTAAAILLYTAVAVALLARLAFGHLGVWRMVRRAKSVPDLTFGGVPVRESGEVAVPLTVGVGRAAVIVLPAGFADAASPERLGAVLAHESAHIRRGDYLSQTFADIVCAVYFANPLAWFLSAAMRWEAERAADDRVLADSRVRPSEYAEHLLDTVRVLRDRRAMPPFAVTMARRADVSARIRAVLTTGTNRTGRIPVLSIVGIGLAGAAFSGGIAMLREAHGFGSNDPRDVAPVKTESAAPVASFRRTLADGTHVEILSVAKGTSLNTKNRAFWKPDGQPINHSRTYSLPYGQGTGGLPDPNKPEYEVAVAIQGPRSDCPEFSRKGYVIGAGFRGISSGSGGTKLPSHVSLITGQLNSPSENSMTVRVGVAKGKWHILQTMAGFQDLGSASTQTDRIDSVNTGTKIPSVALALLRPYETPEGTVVTVSHGSFGQTDVDYRFVAETWDGKTVVGRSLEVVDSSGVNTVDAVLLPGTPRARVKEFRMQARTYDWVTFSGVALKPKPENPYVQVLFDGRTVVEIIAIARHPSWKQPDGARWRKPDGTPFVGKPPYGPTADDNIGDRTGQWFVPGAFGNKRPDMYDIVARVSGSNDQRKRLLGWDSGTLTWYPGSDTEFSPTNAKGYIATTSETTSLSEQIIVRENLYLAVTEGTKKTDLTLRIASRTKNGRSLFQTVTIPKIALRPSP